MYIYIFSSSCPPNAILPVTEFTLRPILRCPILAALLPGTPAAGVSQTMRRGRPIRHGITEVLQTTPPIFGWAAITLGIGPHSRSNFFLSLTLNVTINVQIISAPQTIDVITIQISGNSHLKQSLNSQTALNNSFSLRSHNSFHYQLVTFILTFARHGNALAIKPWFRVKIKIKDFKMFSR